MPNTPRLSSQDIERLKSMAGYGEQDVVISATLFDELVAQYHTKDGRYDIGHTDVREGRFQPLGLAPHEKVCRA